MALSERRRALTIGVSTFGDRVDLTFADGLVTSLAMALEALGYTCTSRSAQMLSSEELGASVARELESAGADDVQVVHVLTHGESGDGDGTVYALGSDGERHPRGDIDHWLKTAQNTNQPLTLFLLDLCHAGNLARLPWQTALADNRMRAWVIAATEGDQSAYEGRFTQAVINVLRGAAKGQLDIDPTQEYIPLEVVARAIRRELNRLVDVHHGYPQNVTATVVDISAEVDLPFFPNLRFAPTNRDLALRASLEPGLVPFLDEGLDARHFVERGAGVGLTSDAVGFEGLIGCFAGRDDQLKQLSPWLNRQESGTLAVVTGSPGVGKSALLGVLVCAAHPRLRDQTQPVWQRVTQFPNRIDDGFAAIHARQRSLPAILASLADQLELGRPTTVEDLVVSIRRLPVSPVIVIDALDEADDGAAVMNELLLPLSNAPVRLLVGTRRNDRQYMPLLQAAEADGFVVDLDDVPRDELAKDLAKYVWDLLWATNYRDDGGVRGAFAAEVAKTLAMPWTELPGERWGEFLVAGLYARHLVSAHPEPLTDPADAKRLGAAVPRALPEVLELDLAARPTQHWLRPALSALAHAKGQGMPASVLARAAAAFSDGATEPPTHDELRDVLGAGRVYLRQATDTDHTTLYRLFHQGLAEHLREHPRGLDASLVGLDMIPLLDHLLDPLGPAGARDWCAAEPYVLRHAIQHANDAGRANELLDDPEFLLTSDHDIVQAHTDRDRRTDMIPFSGTLQERRAALALNAARAGLTKQAVRVANPPGQKPVTWQPLWTAGNASQHNMSHRPPPAANPETPTTIRYSDIGVAHRIACTERVGKPVAVVAAGRTLHVVGLEAHQRTAKYNLGHTAGIDDLACTTTETVRNFAVTVASRDRLAILQDLTSFGISDVGEGFTIGPSSRFRRNRAVACGQLDFAGPPIAVIAAGRRLYMFDLKTREPLGKAFTGHRRPVTAVAYTRLGGWRPVVVTGSVDTTIRIWDLEKQEQIGPPLTGHRRRITAIACARIDGRDVMVSASDDGTIRIWDLKDRHNQSELLTDDRHPDWLEVCTLADGRVVALFNHKPTSLTPNTNHFTSMEGTPLPPLFKRDYTYGVEIWDLWERRLLRWLEHEGPVAAGACAAVDGRQVVITAAGQGTIQMWDLGARCVYPSVRVCLVDDRLLLVAEADGAITARNLANGAQRWGPIPGNRPLVGIRAESLDGRSVAVLEAASGTNQVLDVDTGTVIRSDPRTTAIRTASSARGPMVSVVLEDRDVVINGQYDGSVVLRDSETQVPVTTWTPRHAGPVTTVTAMEIDGQLLAFSGSTHGDVRVWDVAAHRQLDVIELGDRISSIDVTKDGYLVVVAAGEVVVFRHAGSSAL